MGVLPNRRLGFEEGAQTLDRILTAKGFAHDFALRPGGHGWSYLSQYLKFSLVFHWRCFEKANRSSRASGKGGGAHASVRVIHGRACVESPRLGDEGASCQSRAGVEWRSGLFAICGRSSANRRGSVGSVESSRNCGRIAPVARQQRRDGILVAMRCSIHPATGGFFAGWGAVASITPGRSRCARNPRSSLQPGKFIATTR